MPEYYLLIPKDDEEKNHSTLPQAYFVPQTFGKNMFGKDFKLSQFYESVEPPEFDPQRFYCVRVSANPEGAMLNQDNIARAMQPRRYNGGIPETETVEPLNIEVQAQLLPDKSERSKAQVKEEFEAKFNRATPPMRAHMQHVETVAALKTANNMSNQVSYCNASEDQFVIIKGQEIAHTKTQADSVAKSSLIEEQKLRKEPQGIGLRAKLIIGKAQEKLLGNKTDVAISKEERRLSKH